MEFQLEVQAALKEGLPLLRGVTKGNWQKIGELQQMNWKFTFTSFICLISQKLRKIMGKLLIIQLKLGHSLSSTSQKLLCY